MCAEDIKGDQNLERGEAVKSKIGSVVSGARLVT